jgi:hypothetical protein
VQAQLARQLGPHEGKRFPGGCDRCVAYDAKTAAFGHGTGSESGD